MRWKSCWIVFCKAEIHSKINNSIGLPWKLDHQISSTWKYALTIYQAICLHLVIRSIYKQVKILNSCDKIVTGKRYSTTVWISNRNRNTDEKVDQIDLNEWQKRCKNSKKKTKTFYLIMCFRIKACDPLFAIFSVMCMIDKKIKNKETMLKLAKYTKQIISRSISMLV